MTIRSEQYSLNNVSIASLEVGDAKLAHTSVVFLHGWLDNSASFTTTLTELHALAPELHLCAIDLPGHGLSSHKAAGHYYPFHDYIDDVFQFIQQLNPNKLVIVGHSLGALIVSGFCAAFPERVAGLVQIEGFGPLAEDEAQSVSRLRQGVLSRQRISQKPIRYFPDVQTAINRRAKVNNLAPDLIAPVVKRGTVEKEGAVYWRHDRKLQSDSIYRMSPTHARAILSAIVCPQLIILGEQGYQELKAVCDENMNEQIHGSVIQGGHHCHLEYPNRVSSLILGLVNKI